MTSGVTAPACRGFIWRAVRYETGQLRRFKHAPSRSAIPPIADVSLQRSEPPLRANTTFAANGFYYANSSSNAFASSTSSVSKPSVNDP